MTYTKSLNKCMVFVLMMMLSVLTSSCYSNKQEQAISQLDAFRGGGKLQDAEKMLRLDDFRNFEEAEINFLTLRLYNRENTHIAGWLAQLYVAWAEQLQNEVNILRMRLKRIKTTGSQKEIEAAYHLMDYRISQLNEVEDAAKGICNLLISYNSEAYISHRVMADYYRLMGDEKMMNQELEEVEKLNPDSNGLVFVRGAGLMRFHGKYMEALALFEKAIKKDPGFVKAVFYKGLVYSALGDSTKADEVMREVLKASPNHPGAKTFLSKTAYIKELGDEARANMPEAGKSKVKTSYEGPKLVLWAGTRNQGKPGVRCRIKGAINSGNEHKLLVSLVSDGGERVVATKESLINMTKGDYQSINVDFDLDTAESKGRLEVFVHHMIRIEGGDNKNEDGEFKYRTVEMRSAFVPAVDVQRKDVI